MLADQQVEAYRRMTPTEKWRQSKALYYSVRNRKRIFLRQQHPEWSDEAVDKELKRIFLYARS